MDSMLGAFHKENGQWVREALIVDVTGTDQPKCVAPEKRLLVASALQLLRHRGVFYMENKLWVKREALIVDVTGSDQHKGVAPGI